MSALQALSTGFSLMWERKEVNSFDVTHAQTMPSCHVLDYSWGEHLHLQSELERLVC